MIGKLLSRSHGIMPPPRRFAGQPPRALRAQVVRPAKLPACGKNGIYRKNDTQLEKNAWMLNRPLKNPACPGGGKIHPIDI
jgi:hypothetical protein